MHPSWDETSHDVHIPFMYPASEIPFARWQMVSEKVFQTNGPAVIQSVIITHKGEVYVQYAMEVNDESDYPPNGQRLDMSITSTKKPNIPGLVESDEKRSYE
jgi:hypothetical protein